MLYLDIATLLLSNTNIDVNVVDDVRKRTLKCFFIWKNVIKNLYIYIHTK